MSIIPGFSIRWKSITPFIKWLMLKALKSGEKPHQKISAIPLNTAVMALTEKAKRPGGSPELFYG